VSENTIAQKTHKINRGDMARLAIRLRAMLAQHNRERRTRPNLRVRVFLRCLAAQ
jgi:hypothetical protein